MSEPYAIEAEGLAKAFGRTRALDGLDLQVEAGTILGMLGPNGAGKTTAVRVLTTLLRPDRGTARVAGYDVRHRGGPGAPRRSASPASTRRWTSASPAGRTWSWWASSCRLPQQAGPAAGRRAAGPVRPGRRRGPRRSRPTRAACGGASTWPRAWWPGRASCSLTSRRPALTRAAAWSPGTPCARSPPTGTTVLLTTQHLEEADQLADRIAVVDHGRVIAEGTSARAEGQGRRRAGAADRGPESDLAAARERAGRGTPTGCRTPTRRQRTVEAPVDGGARRMPDDRARARRGRRAARRPRRSGTPRSTTCSSP